MGKITVLLVAPEGATRNGICEWLRGHDCVALRPYAVDHARCLVAVESIRPDVVLIDATSNGERALQLVSGIARLSSATKALMLYTRCSDDCVATALCCGASGALDIRCNRPDLVRAVRTVHAGELWTSRKALALAYRRAVAPRSETARESGLHALLSRRETEIVEWMQRGLTNKEVARKLGISDMTVKTHAHNIFHKLEVSGRLRLLGRGNERSAGPSDAIGLLSAVRSPSAMPGEHGADLKPVA